MKKLLLILCWISFANAQQNLLKYVDFYDIKDINFDVFENPKYKKYYNKSFEKTSFFKKYFSVWNEQQSISDKEFLEYFNYDDAVKNYPCIAVNYNKFNTKIIDEIKQNIAIEKTKIGTKIEFGLTLKTTDLRRFPSDEICYKKVRNAGENYPFDYFQYASLWIASPVSVLTKSNDGLWCFVNSQNNKGWVKADEIVIITEKQAKDFQKMNFVTPIQDKTILKSTKSYKVYLGTVLPLVNNMILLPKKNIHNKLSYDKVLLSKSFDNFPIAFTKNNVKKILSELHHFKYTWGGLNEGRDCSSTLKDFYTPFGLWLPRNSSQQMKTGTTIALKGSNSQKLKKINKHGIPFLTTLFKPGHIVLYVGNSTNNTPIIFQNVWGVKAYYTDSNLLKLAQNRDKYGIFGIHQKKGKTETRFNIGEAVFTKIEPSKCLEKQFSYLTTESYLKKFTVLTTFN